MAFPTIGSSACPNFVGGPAKAAVGFGPIIASPYKLPPGCAAEYKFPLDRAKLSRLRALAVLAFSAAISRLPGHCAERLGPLNTTAQIVPSRLTTAAHS